MLGHMNRALPGFSPHPQVLNNARFDRHACKVVAHCAGGCSLRLLDDNVAIVMVGRMDIQSGFGRFGLCAASIVVVACSGVDDVGERVASEQQPLPMVSFAISTVDIGVENKGYEHICFEAATTVTKPYMAEVWAEFVSSEGTRRHPFYYTGSGNQWCANVNFPSDSYTVTLNFETASFAPTTITIGQTFNRDFVRLSTASVQQLSKDGQPFFPAGFNAQYGDRHLDETLARQVLEVADPQPPGLRREVIFGTDATDAD